MTEGISIMGIVNLTDNSYFAPSRCLGEDGAADVEKVLGKVESMLREGADIIDIGACSTRPGAEPVGAAEEWRRLEGVLRAVWGKFPKAVVSIDTYWASVVEKAYALAVDSRGLFSGEIRERICRQLIVNDISAGEDDAEMLPLVGRLGLPYVAMHKRGNSMTMQGLCDYEDVVEELLEYFSAFAAKAESFGIRDWILDPGFGFAKNAEQNYRLLRELGRFAEFGRPVLVGISRKGMVYRTHGITPEEALPQTQVLHYAALKGGATILRVHDVAEAVRTVRSWSMLK